MAFFLNLIFLLIIFVYLLSKYKLYNFNKYGIKYLDPIPFLGNIHRTILGLEHMTVLMKKVYDSFPSERYYAVIEFINPTIVIRDPETIKRVTIKDFDYFHDIPLQIDEDIDPIFGRNLLIMKGEKWHQMRSALSPAFTSFKMKNMFVFMTECAHRVTKFYTEEISASKESYDIDSFDVASRFTIDVIASTAFSLEVDSCKDRNNEFFTNACAFTTPNFIQTLKFIGFRVFPRLMRVLRIKFLSNKQSQYFSNLMSRTIKQRENSGVVRMDMLHLLLEAKKGSLKYEEETDAQMEFASAEESTYTRKVTNTRIKWTENDIIAQTMVFIFAGHRSTSTLFGFLMYEMVVNPHIQERLREEIDSVVEQSGDKISYYDIVKMKYLDMVVSECLRKWLPIPFIQRLCVQDYNMGPVREGSTDHIVIKKGDNIQIPTHSIHMDPNLWPDPETFDPERFSKENIKNINPQSFFPFGAGPRNCIGSRFALLNLKVMVFYMINNFEFKACPKTTIPIKLNTRTLLLESSTGYWVTMKLRKEKSH